MEITKFDELVGTFFQKRAEAEAAAAKVTEMNKELNKLKGELVGYLKEMNRKDYDSPHGKITIKTVMNVTVPRSDEEKAAFFEWLNKKNIFFKYATVNSQSLQSLWRTEYENASYRGEGMDFGIPGVGQPKPFESLMVRTKGTKDDHSSNEE